MDDQEIGKSDKTKANLSDLPAELRLEILRDLMITEPDGPRASLRGLASFRRISRSFYQTAETVGNNGITKLIKTIRKNVDRLDEIKSLSLSADLIPLKTAKERSENVQKTFKIEDGPIKNGNVHGLILNVDYLNRGDLNKIAKYVCDLQQKKGGAENLVKKLIERLEPLGSNDRASLVETTCGIKDPDKRRVCLNAWAGKMDLIEDQGQDRIVSRICEDCDSKGHSLGLFAKHLDKLAPDNRKPVIEKTIELSPDSPGRIWALSQLAAKLSDIDENLEFQGKPLRRKVVSDILSEFSQLRREPPLEYASQWYTDPLICKVEALHHLSSHKDLLKTDELERVESCIQVILKTRRAEYYPIQSQLIPHMLEEQRNGFVSKAFEETANRDVEYGDTRQISLEEGVILGVTLRMGDLSQEEMQQYVDFICDRGIRGDFIDEAAKYNFNQHLKRFNKEQRTDLVNERLDFILMTRADAASEAFSAIARNAKHLSARDIFATTKIAKEATELFNIFAADDDSAVSFAPQSARALATWSSEELAREAHPRRSVVEVIQPQHNTKPLQESTSALSGYDQRSRDRSTSR